VRLGIAIVADELAAGMGSGELEEAVPFLVRDRLDEAGAKLRGQGVVGADRHPRRKRPGIDRFGGAAGEARGDETSCQRAVPATLFGQPGASHVLLLGESPGEIESQGREMVFCRP